MSRQMLCPCGSGTSYETCCKPFHEGSIPETALKLMRSRYSAYALHLPAYIISTTHPLNSQFDHDILRWSHQIMQFCLQTTFEKLEILEDKEQESSAIVTFRAYLRRNTQDVSFTEKSTFERIDDKWFYLKGQIIPKGT